MKIVVVDDTKIILRMVHAALTDRYEDRFTILVFHDPREALREICTKGANILISDIEMPLVMGTELAYIARRIHHSRIKIILMSGRIFPDGIDAPHDVFMAKPFKTEKLYEAVERLIAEQV